MILTMIANREKSTAEPAAYLSKALGQFPSALKRQCIPEDPSLWAIDRFDEFLAARRKLIAGAMNDYHRPIERTIDCTNRSNDRRAYRSGRVC